MMLTMIFMNTTLTTRNTPTIRYTNRLMKPTPTWSAMAAAGRRELRDLVDLVTVHQTILPLGAVVEPLTSVAAQLDQPVQWTEEDGLPVALVTLTNWEAENVQIVLREVRIEAERLVLVGETQPVIVGKQFD